jgi:hypothetical protein
MLQASKIFAAVSIYCSHHFRISAGAPWEEVIKALMSNTVERSSTVTLLFERQVNIDTEVTDQKE